jgi:hypothetical protein
MPGGPVGPIGRYEWEEDDKYGILATLSVFPPDSQPAPEPSGTLSSLENAVGSSGRRVSSVTLLEFFGQVAAFLSESRISGLDRVDVGNRGPEERTPTGVESNVRVQSLQEAEIMVANNQRQPNQATVVAYGISAGFEVKLVFTFNRVHHEGKPAILLEVRAMPPALRKRDGEDNLDYMDRINALYGDKEFVAKLQRESPAAFAPVLEGYKLSLERLFHTNDIVADIKTDMADVVV